MIDEKAALVAERCAFYETLIELAESDWDAPSLCAGWRVRDVAAHTHLAATMKGATLIKGMARARGNFDRFMAGYVPCQGSKPVAEILSVWAAVACSAKVVPTTRLVAGAVDVFVHHHDIALPLRRSVPTDRARLRWLIDGMVTTGAPLRGAARIEGLRLIATDIDWHYGTGPEVRGSAAALIISGCGRRALDHELVGDGLVELQRRG